MFMAICICRRFLIPNYYSLVICRGISRIPEDKIIAKVLGRWFVVIHKRNLSGYGRLVSLRNANGMFYLHSMVVRLADEHIVNTECLPSLAID